MQRYRPTCPTRFQAYLLRKETTRCIPVFVELFLSTFLGAIHFGTRISSAPKPYLHHLSGCILLFSTGLGFGNRMDYVHQLCSRIVAWFRRR